MPDTWLEPSTVTAVLGSVAQQIEATSLAAIVPGVRDWVQEQRKDLFVVDAEDPEVVTFVAPPRVVLGAAMLVWRTYDRRRTPAGLVGSSEDGYAGVVKEDPDIARYLGVGSAGKFVFGGYNPPAVEVV